MILKRQHHIVEPGIGVCLLVLIVFVISRLVYLIGIETAAKLVTYRAREASGLSVS